jgi:hypothetical protein
MIVENPLSHPVMGSNSGAFVRSQNSFANPLAAPSAAANVPPSNPLSYVNFSVRPFNGNNPFPQTSQPIPSGSNAWSL